MPSNAQYSSHQVPQPSPPNDTHSRSRMLSVFNLIRTSVYGVVFGFTIICLAMAGQFQHILSASDLTRFVPFAIFVCSTSIFAITILLGFSFFLRERNPISTRIELSCLALLGIFWLALGAYLANSDSQSADVECFASESSTQPLANSAADFHTDQYQAMYRVLNSFALINAVLVLLFCIGLLFLAIRRQRKGDDHMWHGPVTSCAWFNNYGMNVKRGQSGSSSSSILPFAAAVAAPGTARTRYVERRGHYSENKASRGRRGNTEKPLPPGPMRQDSGSSSLIGSFSSNGFERGGMINPNAGRSHGSR